jgi:hypothetical protein
LSAVEPASRVFFGPNSLSMNVLFIAVWGWGVASSAGHRLSRARQFRYAGWWQPPAQGQSMTFLKCKCFVLRQRG